MTRPRRVLVTGIGVVSPLGVGAEEFWRNCLAGRQAVEQIPERWREYGALVSRVWAPLPKLDLQRFHLGPSEARQLDPTQILGLAATQLALEDAGVPVSCTDARRGTFRMEGVSPDSVGVHFGCGMGGLNALSQAFSHIAYAPLRRDETSPEHHFLQVGPPRLNRFTVPMAMPNGAAARIGLRYQLTGPNRVHSIGCASGTSAIAAALGAVRSGEIDMAISGGVEYLADPLGVAFRSFDVARTLIQAQGAPETLNRPFDRDRSGFLFSEGGCAVLVLEEEQSALRRRGRTHRSYAELRGAEETFDGYSIMSLDPSGTQIERMLRTILARSGLAPADVDYVNAHGTGTQVNDEVEAGILERVFGGAPMVNSTKSLTGHAIGASGAIEAAVTALSIADQATHPSVNLESPIRELDFVTTQRKREIRHAISHSFAFGGHNSALLFAHPSA